MRLSGQSAMEYLTTYGWAILIIAVVASVFAVLLLRNNIVKNVCVLPAEFSCIRAYVQSNGTLVINLVQSTQSPINITALGCNTNATVLYMTHVSPPVTLQIGNNATESVACKYRNGTAYTQPPGTLFKGYFIFNYTDLQTGFPHTETGTLAEVTT